jgi:hypothetical protein
MQGWDQAFNSLFSNPRQEPAATQFIVLHFYQPGGLQKDRSVTFIKEETNGGSASIL